MYPYQGNFEHIQTIVNKFFADNPTGVLPGVILAFKVPEKETDEPSEVIITYVPQGPKDEIMPQVEYHVSVMRNRKDIAYVFRVHEAWGLMLTSAQVGNKTIEEAAQEHAHEKKSILVIELYTKDEVRVSVSPIDDSTENKYVPEYKPLEVPELRWSPHDPEIAGATRH